MALAAARCLAARVVAMGLLCMLSRSARPAMRPLSGRLGMATSSFLFSFGRPLLLPALVGGAFIIGLAIVAPEGALLCCARLAHPDGDLLLEGLGWRQKHAAKLYKEEQLVEATEWANEQLPAGSSASRARAADDEKDGDEKRWPMLTFSIIRYRLDNEGKEERRGLTLVTWLNKCRDIGKPVKDLAGITTKVEIVPLSKAEDMQMVSKQTEIVVERHFYGEFGLRRELIDAGIMNPITNVIRDPRCLLNFDETAQMIDGTATGYKKKSYEIPGKALRDDQGINRKKGVQLGLTFLDYRKNLDKEITARSAAEVAAGNEPIERPCCLAVDNHGSRYDDDVLAAFGHAESEYGIRIFTEEPYWTMAEAWPAAAVDGAEGGRGAWSAAAVEGAQGEDEGADGARSATVAEGSPRPTRKAGEEAGRETVSRGPRRCARGWLQRVSCSEEYRRPMLGCARCRRQTVALAAREADTAASTSVSEVHYLALGPIGR
ncbi:hypothetical protein T492DRAFT_882709 [Pavlovales sp. CCMP2436]|nr:hypothetical protein T492DRAFT_882709 [Pavlovales sp. CCMP2436]